MTDRGSIATLTAPDRLRRLPLIATQDARAARGNLTASLVLRAQRGESAAFEQLIAARVDRLYRLGLAILRSEPAARDAVQDAIVSSWQSLPGLRQPDRFDAWLDRVLINTCRMVLRHRRVVRVREISVHDADGGDWTSRGALSPAPDDDIASLDELRQAFTTLDADQRALIVLHHVEGRTIEEIARVIGIPTGTVKWRLHAARAALERALEEARR